MRYEFCTLFDHKFLARGLVLYRSLAAHCPSFRLHVFCMDRLTQRVLAALELPDVVLVPRAELAAHDLDLRAVEDTRSTTEYYWTATPSICLFTLERNPDIDHVVHLDADVEFAADPAPAFAELGPGSILLTPHRPSPEFSDGIHEAGGYFNVQFEVFRRDADGLAALRWWRERCLEWCYDRMEPDRYGDQKYLEQLPARFGGVRVCSHPGAGLAPWNVGNHTLELLDDRVLVDGEPLLFHHYQSLQLHALNRFTKALARWFSAYRVTPNPVPLVWTTGWRLTERQLALLWVPYVGRLSRAYADLHAALPGADLGPPPQPSLSSAAFHIARRYLPPPVRAAYWRLRDWAAQRRNASATRSTSASDNSG